MKKPAEKNIGQLTNEIYALLDGVSEQDAVKVLTSVSTLLGLNLRTRLHHDENQGDFSDAEQGERTAHKKPASSSNAKVFFDEKDPQTKGEEFAVAAKYRIENGLGDSHTKEDLKEVIKTKAKRSFNDKNFHRDIDNAIRQAKFFLKDDGKGQYMLSIIGEKFVDALPDRSAANEVRKSKSSTKKKKKSSTNKKSKK